MVDRLPSLTTPPTTPRTNFSTPLSPSSPRPYNSFPLVPPAPVGSHPQYPTRHSHAITEYPLPPATLDINYAQGKEGPKKVLLELADGSSFVGFSFGAQRSVSGELVFQTGES
jgi:hypothetical protein